MSVLLSVELSVCGVPWLGLFGGDSLKDSEAFSFLIASVELAESDRYWNAFVAALEMHGVGRFFDPRLNNAAKFPIAAANGFADLPHIDPEQDRITKKLPSLHFYQLAIPAPAPEAGVDFDAAAAARGL